MKNGIRLFVIWSLILCLISGLMPAMSEPIEDAVPVSEPIADAIETVDSILDGEYPETINTADVLDSVGVKDAPEEEIPWAEGIDMRVTSSVGTVTNWTAEISAKITLKNNNARPVTVEAIGVAIMNENDIVTDMDMIEPRAALAANATGTYSMQTRFRRLTPGTTYRYVYMAIIDGRVCAEDNVGEFRTGDADPMDDIEIYAMPRTDNITTASADIEVGMRVTNLTAQAKKLEKAGIRLYDAAGNPAGSFENDYDLTIEPSKQVSPVLRYHAEGLTPDTEYDYLPYVIVDGKTYIDYRTDPFTTKSGLVAERVEPDRAQIDFDLSQSREPVQLNASVYPETASQSVVWSSNDPEIAEVSAAGVVTPKKRGSTTIFCASKPYPSVFGQCTINVTCSRHSLVIDPAVDPTLTEPGLTEGSHCEYCDYVYAGQEVIPPLATALKPGQKLGITMNVGDVRVFRAAEGYAPKSSKTSAKGIAKVSGGTVTAVGEGTAKITMTFTNGKTATVTVNVVDPYRLRGVRLDQTGTVRLEMGSELVLSATASPELSAPAYSWKSSDTKIAKVVNGTVVPVKEGTATITVTAMRGSVKKTASVKVKVVDPYKPTAVKLDRTGTVRLEMDTELTLTPSLAPETAVATYSWKSSDKKIAKVANGVVIPVAEGTVTITVIATRGKVKKTASVKVKVVDPFKPTGLKLDMSGTVKLDLGDELTLAPTLTPVTAVANYTWKSSATKIAAVQDGVVRAIKEGTATITLTATRGRVKKTASVKVKVIDPQKLTGITVTPAVKKTIRIGETLQLNAAPKPATVTDYALTWKSSKPGIASVDGTGMVTGLKPGKAVITAVMKKGTVKKTLEVNITVVG